MKSQSKTRSIIVKFANFLSFAIFIIYSTTRLYAAGDNIDENSEQKSDSTEVKSVKYDKIFLEDGKNRVAKGEFVSLSKSDDKLYLEIAEEYLNREFLLAATVTATSHSDVATVGYKPKDPMHCKFVMRDSVLYLERINVMPDVEHNGVQGVQKIYKNPIIKSFKSHCANPDTGSIVVEATSLFHDDIASLSALDSKTSIGLSVKGKYIKELSSIDELKSFDDNFSVLTTKSYTVTTSFLGLLSLLKDEPVSLQVTYSALLLPQEKMQPRLADTRIGIFLTDKWRYSKEYDKLMSYSVVNRWRLEYSDTLAVQGGALSKPVKPIVFYVDNSFPQEWVEPIKKGVLRWNRAFEQIGFQDAIIVESFPEDDAQFDPDNLKYSCVRYVPSATSNAMGPSWVDPTTGEIISASVLVYNDVVKLINNWRFTQTAQVDERVRSVKMPDDIISESLEYVVAHEVGHCLGFMHNMRASAAYSVDSLRSESFTKEFGTTASIMDYARFNYIAQPEDNDVSLTPPFLGLYDYHLIKYNYKPVVEANSMWGEKSEIESWITRHSDDPIYTYGRQQLSLRIDPNSIEEDLGDDPIKASSYGVVNLKYIMANLNEWIGDDQDPDYQHRRELYASIISQYNRYIQAVMINIGGVELSDESVAQRATSVDMEYQIRSAEWVMNEMRNCQWIDQKDIIERMPLNIGRSYDLAKDIIGDLFKKVATTTLSSHIASSQQAYTPSQFLDMLYQSVWSTTVKGESLSKIDMLLQREFIESSMSVISKQKKSAGASSLVSMQSAYAPTINQILLYDDSAQGICDDLLVHIKGMESEFMDYQNNFGPSGYNWQRRVSTSVIDQSDNVMYDILLKNKKLLDKAVKRAKGDDKLHYQSLCSRLEWLLEM